MLTCALVCICMTFFTELYNGLEGACKDTPSTPPYSTCIQYTHSSALSQKSVALLKVIIYQCLYHQMLTFTCISASLMILQTKHVNLNYFFHFNYIPNPQMGKIKMNQISPKMCMYRGSLELFIRPRYKLCQSKITSSNSFA